MADSGNCKALKGRRYLVPVVFDKEQEENMEGQREKHGSREWNNLWPILMACTYVFRLRVPVSTVMDENTEQVYACIIGEDKQPNVEQALKVLF